MLVDEVVATDEAEAAEAEAPEAEADEAEVAEAPVDEAPVEEAPADELRRTKPKFRPSNDSPATSPHVLTAAGSGAKVEP